MQDAGIKAFRAAQDTAVKQGRVHDTLPGRLDYRRTEFTGWLQERLEARFGYVFSGGYVLLLAAFGLIPTAYALYLAFTRDGAFVGIDNFANALAFYLRQHDSYRKEIRSEAARRNLFTEKAA